MKLFRSKALARRGLTLVEVIASISLMTLLMIPMFAVLKSSSQVWGHFNSSHISGADRINVVNYLASTLDNATAITEVKTNRLTIVNAAGRPESVYQSGVNIFRSTDAGAQILAANVGTLQFTRLPVETSTTTGSLIQISLTGNADASNGSKQVIQWIHKPL